MKAVKSTPGIRLLRALAVLLVLTQTGPLAAQPEDLQISELTPLDEQYMMQQRRSMDELARRELGTGFDGTRDNDLALIQRMLDTGLVRDSDRTALQALGIILGDLLAADLDMHWVIYSDELGRSRALRYRETENYLFPATMISRRREAGDRTPVDEIYRKAYGIIDPLRPRLPFE